MSSFRCSFIMEHRNTIDATVFAHSQAFFLLDGRSFSAMGLQGFDAVILRQNLHLADGDGIEFCQPFGLRHPLVDEHRIQVLQIGQADQLRDIGVVTDIPFQIGMAGLSRHCFAVIPNRAMFNTSASLAYTMEICFAESSGGIRFSLIASVWMR